MKRQNKTIHELFPQITFPILFGHRGCSARNPENTLIAFQAALENKIPGIELDIHLTKDNEIVIAHDDNCQRTTGINCSIQKSTLAELKKLNTATLFNQKGSTNCKIAELCTPPQSPIETEIPTLEELFQLAGDRFFYDIEVKVKRRRKICLQKIDTLVKKHNLTENMMLSSFDPLTIRLAQKYSFKGTALIYKKGTTLFQKAILTIKLILSKCNILKPQKTIARVALESNPNKPIMTWTVDDIVEANQLLTEGVIGICSNHPEDFTLK